MAGDSERERKRSFVETEWVAGKRITFIIFIWNKKQGKITQYLVFNKYIFYASASVIIEMNSCSLTTHKKH